MKRASLPWSVKQLVKMIDKGTISFELAAQRNRVWDLNRESLLIDSTLRDYPIPALLATRNEGESGNVYYIIDGKQRGLTFSRFLKGEFTLQGLNEIETEEGVMYNINGLTFAELPEDLQDTINSYSLTAHYLMDATEEEVNDIFFRENNGMPLTKFELTRVKASPLMPTITAITEHEVFSKFAISEKQKLRYTDQEIALQMLITYFDETPSFVGDYMQTWAEKFSITAEQQKHIQSILEVFKYIAQYSNEKAVKKAFKKVHISGLTYLINKYGRDNMSNYVSFVNQFFEGRSVPSDKYTNNSKAGSAKPEAIKKRFDAINEFYNEIKFDANKEEQQSA
jgi:hypothetical protein